MNPKFIKATPIRCDFCRVIKDIRKARSMTQLDLAECLNVSRTTIHRWEFDGHVPDANMLITAMATFPEMRDHIIGVTYLAHCKSKT